MIRSPILSSQDFVAPFHSRLRDGSPWSWCSAPGQPGAVPQAPPLALHRGSSWVMISILVWPLSDPLALAPTLPLSASSPFTCSLSPAGAVQFGSLAPRSAAWAGTAEAAELGAWGHGSGTGTWTQTRDPVRAATHPRAVRQGGQVAPALAQPRRVGGLHLVRPCQCLLLAGHWALLETPARLVAGGTGFLHHPPGPCVASRW